MGQGPSMYNWRDGVNEGILSVLVRSLDNDMGNRETLTV